MDKEEIKSLLDFKTLMDSDEIRYKEVVKKRLLDNKRILHILNNKELEDAGASADEYFGVNILPYYMVKPTQTDIQNYICYDVQFDEESRFNKIMKYGQIIFYILCEHQTLVEKNTGLARHDLLSALLMDEFNWTHCFGKQIHCVSNKPSVVDTDYAARTIVFEMEVPNSIAKTRNNTTRVINSENHN